MRLVVRVRHWRVTTDEVLLRAYNEDIRGFELRARTTGTERKYRYFELNCECRRRSGAEVISRLLQWRSSIRANDDGGQAELRYYHFLFYFLQQLRRKLGAP